MASDLLIRLERQYEECIRSLKALDINCDSVIGSHDLHESIRPAQISLVEEMDQPQLILVPNLTYSHLSDVINRREPLSTANELATFGEKNIFLYNGGVVTHDNKWKASIIDLAPQDLTSLNIKRPIAPAEFINKVVKFYTAKGLQVLTGARSYLALIILQLYLQQPIDVNQEIVLNAESVAKDSTSTISAGSYYDSLVHLHLYDPYTPWSPLYIYPEVRIVG